MEKPKMSFKELVLFLVEDNLHKRRFMKKSTTVPGQIAGVFSLCMFANMIYRLSHYLYCKRLVFISKIFYAINLILFGCEISPMSQIGPGLVMVHFVGNCIHAKIGKNAVLYGRNGIGGKGEWIEEGWYGGPIIGDNAVIGYNVTVLAPVNIGDNVVLGGCSLILDSIPDNKVAAGSPAKVLRDNIPDEK